MNTGAVVVSISGIALFAKIWTDIVEILFFRIRANACVNLLKELNELVN